MPDVQEAIDPNGTYSMREGARLKRVSVTTLRAALVSDRLPAHRVGQRWAIAGADLLAWEVRFRPAPPGWVTVRQAAAATGTAPDTIRSAVRAGRLPATWANGRWLIDPADLDAWQQQRQPVTGPIRPDGLYRPYRAAKLLGVSKQAVSQAVAAGRLPVVETPDGRRIRGSDVLAWTPHPWGPGKPR